MNENNGIKQKVFTNFIWRFAERCGARMVTFAVSIVLARILEPSAYGRVALMTVLITIAQVFVDSGLANALIQKKHADDVDFSTVFYVNVAVCLVLYGAVYIFSPLIAAFYSDSAMIPMIRVLGLTIVVSGLKNVQQAYISRNMLFKKFFFSTLGGTVFAAVAGISLAFWGYGAWALVIQQILNVTIDTCIIWFTVKWRPKRVFSFERLKGLFSFGWKLLASSLLDTIYNNLRQLIIGRMYSTEDLAYYNQGNKFPNLVIDNINSSINSVLLPAMSKEQDNQGHVKNMTRRAIKTSTYIMAPLMMGLAFTAEPVIRLLLADKWLPCIPYLRIFCITYMFQPIHTANLNAINAMGRSDLFLKLEIWKKVIGILILVCSMNFGVMAMAYSFLGFSIISQVINSWPNRKLLNYGYIEQLKDILPAIFLAVVMGAVVSLVGILGLPDIITLAIQVVCGAAIYIAESAVFKIDSFQYLMGIGMPYIFKKVKIRKYGGL